VAFADRLITKLSRMFRPSHHEGYSDGTTEKELKNKARRDGWDV
jgi:hypothetical protein